MWLDFAKWMGVIANLIGAIVISSKLFPVWIGFLFYILGSSTLAILYSKKREMAIVILMLMYLVVDIVGLVRWI